MRFQLFLLFISFGTSLLAQDLGNLKDKKPVQLHAGINLAVQAYQSNLENPIQPGLSWYLTGSPVLEIYGFSLPFYFLFSNQQRNIQQPFNEFGVSPYYKWAKLHLGYFNPVYSPFTLAGKRILGTGVELNPGKFRFAAAYGRFRKPIQYENTPGTSTTYLLPGSEPSYKQIGYSVKIGIGSERNFIDLIYLKGRDVPESNLFPSDLEKAPEENAVIGLSHRITFTEWLSWSADLAVSAYTRDQFSEILPDTTIPAQKFISNIMLPRESSQVYSAAESKLTIGSRPFSISLKYRRIDPDYKSMGAYFFQTDLQSFSLAPRLILEDGKYVLSGSIGRQTDNLYGQKLATTKRIIGSVQLMLQPSPDFNLSAQYSNYGLSQAALNPNLPDTVIIAQVSHQALVSPRFSFGENLRQSINPSFSYYALTGLDASIGSIKSWNVGISYGLQNRVQKWSQQFTLLFRSSQLTLGHLTTYGALWSIQKPFFDNRFNSSFQLAYYQNYQPENPDEKGNLISLMGNVSYRLFKKHQIRLQYAFRRNKAPLASFGQDFLENRGFLIYSLQF
ncbi:MAG: hypothetical protein KDC34_20135 [Saprospiraceae bacterium]|nr:hypothetical protein [Saprospiraceae bacterium]